MLWHFELGAKKEPKVSILQRALCANLHTMDRSSLEIETKESEVSILFSKSLHYITGVFLWHQTVIGGG